MSMTHDEMIAVIAHHRDGGEVEYKHVDNCDYCLDSSPCFDFSQFDYRIKPEPLVLWLVMSPAKCVYYPALSQKAAEDYIGNSARRDLTIKKFIEA